MIATCDEFGAVCRAIKNVTPLIAYKTQNIHDFTKVVSENMVNIFMADFGKITVEKKAGSKYPSTRYGNNFIKLSK